MAVYNNSSLFSQYPQCTMSSRATNKALKIVITHWEKGRKMPISLLRYAFGVQSSAYRLPKLSLSTYCKRFTLHYDKFYHITNVQ